MLGAYTHYGPLGRRCHVAYNLDISLHMWPASSKLHEGLHISSRLRIST